MNIRSLNLRTNLFSAFFLSLIILFTHVNLLNAYSNKQLKNNFFIIADSEGKDFSYYKLETYLYRIENFVYKTLGHNLILKNCKVYLRSDLNELINCSKSNKGNWRIFLKKDYLDIINDENISLNLFNILVSSVLDVPYTENNLDLINWYVSALNRKLYRILKPKIYPEIASFTAINFLLMHRYKLKPETIINNFSKPCDKEVYKFNSEADEILLNTILSIKNGKKILKLFLLGSCNNRGNKRLIDLFYSILSHFLRLNKKQVEKNFTEKLNATAEKYALNVFMPASDYYIESLFDKACVFTFIPENEPKTKVETRLENLPEIYTKVEPGYFTKIKQDLRERFIILHRIAPFFVQKPISEIIKAINDFKPEQKENSFQNKILRFKGEFKKGLEKEKEVYSLLKEKELKHVRIPVRYYYFFDAIDIGNSFQKDLWPGLNEYLTLEYKY